MRLSVLIVNWNGKSFLPDCLNSLRERLSCSYEVIVVDNASTDGSPETIAKEFPWVKLVRSNDNLGFAGGNNLAAEHATGEFLLLLNIDTILETDVAEILSVAEADPKVGAIGALMFGGDGELRPSAFKFPTPMRLWRFADMHARKSASGFIGGIEVRHCDYVEGSFLFTPAALWREMKGMDERNYMYGDDLDYCRSLWNAGYLTVLCPSVRYTHFGGYDHSRMAYLFGGFRRYHRKFSGPLTRLHAEFVLRFGLVLRVPWYWWNGHLGDVKSRDGFRHAVRLIRNWKEAGIDGYRHHS